MSSNISKLKPEHATSGKVEPGNALFSSFNIFFEYDSTMFDIQCNIKYRCLIQLFHTKGFEIYVEVQTYLGHISEETENS